MADNLNFNEQLKKLINLQQIDSEIFDLKIELEAFPAKIEEMDRILETKKTGMENADAKLKAIQVQKSERETDMQAAEEKIQKYDSELAQIKTNKEYKAMLEQIDGVKADVSLLEEKILELFDQIEEAQAELKKEKDIFEEESKKNEGEKQKINEERKKVESRLAELNGNRAGITKDIDESILKRYDKILENRGRSALSKVNGEFCEECNMRLRPQVINEAHLKNDIVVCENCSRILYVQE